MRFGQLVHLPGHAVTLSLEEENLWFEIEQGLRARALDPPRLTAIAERMRLTEEEVRPLLEKLGRMGRLSRLSKVYFVLPDMVARLAGAAQTCAAAHPDAILTVGHFREATAISRHATMPVLEFFDRVGFTRRHQDRRRIRVEADTIFVAAFLPSPLVGDGVPRSGDCVGPSSRAKGEGIGSNKTPLRNPAR